MTRLRPRTHTQQPTHGTHTQPAHAISTTTPSAAIRAHATPTQQTTHGDTRGPKAGCPQTHYQPAHAVSTYSGSATTRASATRAHAKHTTHTHRKAA